MRKLRVGDTIRVTDPTSLWYGKTGSILKINRDLAHVHFDSTGNLWLPHNILAPYKTGDPPLPPLRRTGVEERKTRFQPDIFS